MIKLGKSENGATIFDTDALVKVDILKNDKDDILIYFDTSFYDELRGLHAQWFVYNLEILAKYNIEIYNILDEFYTKAFDLIVNHLLADERYRFLGDNKGILRETNDGRFQINYPSADDEFEQATFLGLERFLKQGFVLSFRKTLKNLKKLSFLLKNGNHYFPELAELYIDCFNKIIDVASLTYDECQETFQYELIRRKRQL